MVTINSDVRVVDTLIDGPTLEPLDLDEVKKALRFTSDTEDTLIDAYISAARQHFEEQTGRQLMLATRERRFYTLPDGPLELPFPPLREVLSVSTGDSGSPDSDLVLGTDYTVSTPTGPHAAPGLIYPVSGAIWPNAAQAIVRYRCGYGNSIGDIPELIRVILHQLVATFHKYRASVQEIKPGAQMAPVPFLDPMILAFKYSALPVYPATRSWV